MMIVLLGIIAVLLWVIAEKLAGREEMNAVFKTCLVGGGLYVLFTQWEVVLAAVYGFVALVIVGVEWFVNSELGTLRATGL